MHRFLLRLASVSLAAVVVLLVASPASAGLDRWTFFGPPGTFAEIRTLTVAGRSDPRAPATLLAATSAGVYRSEDGGRAWTFSGTGLPPGAGVRGIVAAPSDPSVVFLDAFGALYRSFDGGRSWRLAHLPTSTVESLAIDPRDASTVYFADGPDLLRSRDSGDTWVRLFSRNTAIEILVIDPNDPDNLYISNLEQVFKSTDGGGTWTVLDTLEGGASFRGRFSALAVAPGAPDRVYLSGESGFYRSDSGGATWTRLSDGPNLAFLFVDPREPQFLYGASRDGATLLVSRDGGETWRDAGGRPPGVVVRALAFDPATRVLYAGTADQGVLPIVRAGRRWRAAPQQGMPADRIDWLEVHPSDPRRMYVQVEADLITAGAACLLATSDGGRTWRRIAPQVPVARGMAFDPRDPETLYLHNGAVWRSQDGGETWARLARFPSTQDLAFPAPRTLVSAGCGIQRSVDGGRTWTEVLACTLPDPTGGGGGEDFNRNVFDLREDPADPATVYALAVEVGGRHPLVTLPQLYVSRNGGRTWTLSLSGAVFLAVPQRPRRALYAVAEGQVEKSTDAGQTWRPTGTPPGPDYTWTDFEADAQDPSTLYLSTSQAGVFRSTDEGRTWTPLNAGLARLGLLNVRALAVHPTDPHRLFALPEPGIYEGRFPQ